MAGAWAGIAATLSFITLFIAAVSQYPGYSIDTRYLSDLGVGAGSAFIFNSAVIIAGVLGLIFSWGMLWHLQKRGRAGAVLFGAASVSLICIGIFTEKEQALHYLFYGIFFILSAVSALLIAMNFAKAIQWISYITAAFCIFFAIFRLPVLEHLAVIGIITFVFITSMRTLRIANEKKKKGAMCKIGLLLLVAFLNSVGYAGAQILRPHGILVMTWIDSLIPFVPIFVVAYALYFPVALLPFVIYWKDYRAYRVMAFSIAAALAIAILVYLVIQTSVIRAQPDPTRNIFNWGVWQVYQLDAPLNAFPSLHVAIPTLATLFVFAKKRRLGIYLAPITITIILSTVFIKQHSVLDIIGGLALAIVVFKFRNVFEGNVNNTSYAGRKVMVSGSKTKKNAQKNLGIIILFDRLEFKRSRIYAIPLASRFWAVIKQMSQMAPAIFAYDLDPIHAVSVIRAKLDIFFVYRIIKAGPARSGFEFRI